ACDTTNPQQLTNLLNTIPTNHPLTAIIHTAGVTHDGTLGSLTESDFVEVIGPKADAARLLHELTLDHELDAFVLFSSVAGIIGNPGQANYAAANTALDALAQHRHTLGLPATSLAWGLWNTTTGMGAHLNTTQQQRITKTGITPLNTTEALHLFDTALTSKVPLVVPVHVDTAALRRLDGERVPTLLRGLLPSDTSVQGRTAHTRAPATDPGSGAPWVRKLGESAAPDRLRLALDLVRATVAEVLGHPAHHPVPLDRGLLDLGFDSLTAVELRNRLASETGLRLPTTLLFDQPTVSALATHLMDELADQLPGGAANALAKIDELASAFDDSGLDAEARLRIADRLTAVLDRLRPRRTDHPGEAVPAALLDEASDDELFQLIDGSATDSE
ncbi:beta-ketoacyl reductase, partial [Streptomyces sp. NPDC059129]